MKGAVCHGQMLAICQLLEPAAGRLWAYPLHSSPKCTNKHTHNLQEKAVYEAAPITSQAGNGQSRQG